MKVGGESGSAGDNGPLFEVGYGVGEHLLGQGGVCAE